MPAHGRFQEKKNPGCMPTRVRQRRTPGTSLATIAMHRGEVQWACRPKRSLRWSGRSPRDLAILEVALRNAMNARLEARWGVKWYANPSIPLDERSCRQLSEAWSRVSGDKTPGRVIAQCMFGFWRGLLDKGDHIGRAPRRVRCDYEVLWRGFSTKLFPAAACRRRQMRSDGNVTTPVQWCRESMTCATALRTMSPLSMASR